MKTTLTKDDPAGWYLCNCLESEDVQARWWSGNALKVWPTDDWLCNKDRYTNFRRLYTEEEASNFGQCYDELFTANQTLQFQVSTLTSDLEKLKAAPYPMRKADKPDCVGLWISSQEHIFRVCDDSQCGSFTSNPPYYYLGPIPVIPKEQKPPQVVTVRNKKSGQVFRAIPSTCGSSLAVLNDDGSFRGNEMVINWEVVK